MKLYRKVVIISGAAAGIGEASARLFAREGARLVLVDLDAERLGKLTKELEQSGTMVLEIAGDVAIPAVCRNVMGCVTNQFGRIDVLFNNAGIVLNGSLLDCTENDWQRTLDVNLKSMYLLCREAIPGAARSTSSGWRPPWRSAAPSWCTTRNSVPGWPDSTSTRGWSPPRPPPSSPGCSSRTARATIDTHVRVDHLAVRTRSLLDYRGIATGRGRAVFNGKAVVDAGAQQSQARQTNRNLLLTPGAEIDTKPELEIYADDVQCSHGATTGQLDAAALFYLRSRGLSEIEARSALTRAFTGAVMSHMDHPAYATAVRDILDSRLAQLLETQP